MPRYSVTPSPTDNQAKTPPYRMGKGGSYILGALTCENVTGIAVAMQFPPVRAPGRLQHNNSSPREGGILTSKGWSCFVCASSSTEPKKAIRTYRVFGYNRQPSNWIILSFFPGSMYRGSPEIGDHPRIRSNPPKASIEALKRSIAPLKRFY